MVDGLRRGGVRRSGPSVSELRQPASRSVARLRELLPPYRPADCAVVRSRAPRSCVTGPRAVAISGAAAACGTSSAIRRSARRSIRAATTIHGRCCSTPALDGCGRRPPSGRHGEPDPNRGSQATPDSFGLTNCRPVHSVPGSTAGHRHTPPALGRPPRPRGQGRSEGHLCQHAGLSAQPATVSLTPRHPLAGHLFRGYGPLSDTRTSLAPFARTLYGPQASLICPLPCWYEPPAAHRSASRQPRRGGAR